MKGIIASLCGQIFYRRWRWRSYLVNDGSRIRSGDVLFFTCNNFGVMLMIFIISGGRGMARSRFGTANTACVWFFVIKRYLVGAA